MIFEDEDSLHEYATDVIHCYHVKLKGKCNKLHTDPVTSAIMRKAVWSQFKLFGVGGLEVKKDDKREMLYFIDTEIRV